MNMAYKEKKKIIEAAEILKEYCKKSCCNSDNANCLFEKTKGVCSIRKDYPTAWEIPELTRWTSKDIALAKVLKEYGIDSIENSIGRIFLIRKGIAYMFDIGAFSDLGCGEIISIDTIIKEAEE